MQTLKSLLEVQGVSISDKGKAISELSRQQDELYAESRRLLGEIEKAHTEYQTLIKKLGKEQEKIALKLAAITDTMQKLVK